MNIETGTPPCDGLYTAYMAYQARPAEKFPMVLVYGKGQWWYHLSGQKTSLKVEGWIGPLPSWPGQAKLDADRLRDGGFTTAMPVAEPLEYDL